MAELHGSAAQGIKLLRIMTPFCDGIHGDSATGPGWKGLTKLETTAIVARGHKQDMKQSLG
jgi:hypothetical protein